MKRLGGVWEQVISFDNLLLAYRKARRGKRDRIEVARFACGLEKELLALQQALRERRYRPGAYRQFSIYERKPRVIASAPFRDRVVHHALMNVIGPHLDKRLIDDCYASRKNKGVHAAVDRYQAYARQYAYVMKLDIRRYFPSIDHIILKAMLRRRIKDPEALHLLDLMIDTSPEGSELPFLFAGDDLVTLVERRHGIPIGNLTSQFFANVYLDDFDHWLKQDLRVPAYLRYMDDLILLENDKAKLWATCRAIETYLESLRLKLHPDKRQVYRTTDWVDVLGYLVRRDKRRLRSDNGHRFRRRLQALSVAYGQGRVDWKALNASVQSWIGHARHADTLGLRQAIFSMVVFKRERT